MDTTLTRRRLLKGAAQLASVAAASSLMPPNVQRLLAEGMPRNGSMKDIKHVVLLMQENRSFDHYFGMMAGVRGFNDPSAITLSTGNSVFHQPDPMNPKGYLLPFHLDTSNTSAQKIPSTNHGWVCQHQSWNGGRMNQWVTAHRAIQGNKGPYCMGYFKREDIPFQYALAEAFTICDTYHCSVMGPTWPNRMYWFTGSIDPDGKHGGPIIDNEAPTGGYTWTTYPERLEAAGVSWKVYASKDDTKAFNMLNYFRPFQNASKSSPLYTRGIAPVSDGQFAYDCLHDQLPTVSWLCPPRIASEHPEHMPADGAAFVASIIDAIAANPDVWAKTAFILNYDENDGLFDHVQPPLPPRGQAHEWINGLPIGGGFRVPCIIVSPWTTGGWVCSEQFDHTSVLQFLEKFTGVREPNVTGWRRQTFGDLTAAFRFQQPSAKIPTLPGTTDTLTQARYAADHLPLPAIPEGNQSMPDQEKGKRPRVS
jgi:phospholipase C